MAKLNINQPQRLRRFNRNAYLLGVLWLMVMVSGIGVVYSTHLSRQLINELEEKRWTAGNLHVEWGQYLLEQSTWATYSRVERIATEELDMQAPANEKIVIVKRY